ncbi:MAG: hypothetical protein ABIT08_08345 [Bacteroidia bacterium]
MDILNQIINGMNKEQIRYFKLYASRFRSEARKDLALFDYMRKSNDKYDDDKIFNKLYKGKEKNAFYRLKNRLLLDINKSITIQHFDDEETIHAFHLLGLVRFYINRNNVDAAHYFLRKAESKAKVIENNELLDLIYGEFIRLSHEKISINPEVYIKKRKENTEQINQLREIDDILAAVSYRLKITQNFAADENPVLPLLQKTADDFSQDKELKKSHKLRLKLYHAVSQILLQKRDYAALEDYLLNIYKEFNKEKLFNKSNHDTKLQMLTYIVNALFKNNKLKVSLKYAEELRKAMEEFHHLLYDKYIFFYYNSLVINYSIVDKTKAISILEDLRDNEKIKSNTFYQVFVYLNLMLLWFDKQQYPNAIKNLNKLYMLDNYKTTDVALRFRIAVAELIIRYELKDFDLLEYKINQLRKDFKEYLKQIENEKEKEFITILKSIINSAAYMQDKKLLNRVKLFVNLKDEAPSEDREIINYKNWLREKTRMNLKG